MVNDAWTQSFKLKKYTIGIEKQIKLNNLESEIGQKRFFYLEVSKMYAVANLDSQAASRRSSACSDIRYDILNLILHENATKIWRNLQIFYESM